MPDISTIRVIIPETPVVRINVATTTPTVSVVRVHNVFSGGSGGGGFTLNGTSGSVSLVAGSNISLSSGASSITIHGASGGTGGGATFTLNNTTASVSLVAGGAIGLTNNASTISISAPVATNFSTVSLTALGNTTNSSSGTFNNVLQFSGAGIAFVGASLNSVTVSVSDPSQITVQATGNTTVSSLGTINKHLTISGAGIASVGVENGSVTISATTPSVVSSLNASTGQLSISAGAGIGIGQANSTITISASVQTAALTQSLSASGNTTGATSSGTYGSVLAFSGMGIASVGAGNGTVSISVTTPSVTNYSTISGNIAGNTAGTSTFTIGNTWQLSLTGGLSGTASGSSITLSGATAGAALTQSLSASGNTTGATSSGTYGSVLAASGMGGVSVGAGNGTISISGPVQTTLVGGSNISLSSAGSTITIHGLGHSCSYTQNLPINLVSGTIATKAGTVTGTAGFGSSLFLHRLNVPGLMNLTEIDVAMKIDFPATNQGAGTMSRSMVVYSFGNSTSLASVMSASGTSAWNTGTSTAGASTSLTQFQGGWSTPLIQPMTFASTSLAPGEYVVGQLFNFAQGSSTWTVNLYGAVADSNSALTAFSVAPTAFNAMSSSAVAAASGVNAINRYGTDFLALSTSGNAAAVQTFTLSCASAAASSLTASVIVSVTDTGNKSASFALVGVNTNNSIMSNIGTVAGSIFTATASGPVISNAGTAAMTLRGSAIPNFGYIGTGSTTSGLPTAFVAGIMSTGAVPTAITVTSTAVTYSGSAAFVQPWFAIMGQ